MFDEPDIIDQFIKSYDSAVQLFKKKLETYKTIVFSNKELIDLLIQPPSSESVADKVKAKYDEYITHLDVMPNAFSEKIRKMLEELESIERNKRQQPKRGGIVITYAQQNDDIPDITNKIEELRYQLNVMERQPTTVQKTTFIGTIISAGKTFVKSLNKKKKKIQLEIQSLMKKLEEKEIKFSKDIKRFTAETYNNTLNKLFPESRPGSSRRGGKKTIKKNKIKIKRQTKHKYYRNNKKQSNKHKHKNICKYIKTKKIKI